MTSERSLVPEGLSPAVSPAALNPRGASRSWGDSFEGKCGGLVEAEGEVDGLESLSGGAANEVVQGHDDEDCVRASVDGELDVGHVRARRRRGVRPLALGQESDEGFVPVGVVESLAQLVLECCGVEESFGGAWWGLAEIGGD